MNTLARFHVLALLMLGCEGEAAAPSVDTAPDSAPQHAECTGAEDFKVGLEKIGREAAFKILVTDAVPSTPEKFENDWTIELTDVDGAPVPDAAITVEPYMPTHGHDGTFEPEVTPTAEPRRYAVDRINLWMAGPWEVRFFVGSADADDTIVYDVCIEG